MHRSAFISGTVVALRVPPLMGSAQSSTRIRLDSVADANRGAFAQNDLRS
jgi:hypothetical protein